jgi:hypothetical protein
LEIMESSLSIHTRGTKWLGMQFWGFMSDLVLVHKMWAIPGIHITDSVIAFIYEAEVLKCTKQGSYMGIWQLFALADVLKCSVMSSYPMFVRAEIREGQNVSLGISLWVVRW